MSATTTTQIPAPLTAPTVASEPRTEESSGVRRPLSLLGGLCLVAAPLLIVAANLTCPPQASNAAGDYITSLAADPFLTNLSASLYHYGWIAMAFGILAGVGLVRGRKGRILTLVGGLGAAFGCIQLSGLLLNDWWLSALGRHLPLDQAVTVFENVGSPSFSVWMMSAKIGAIALPVVFYAGLARAGVISWWLVPLIALPMVAGFTVTGLVGGVAGVVLGAVVSLAGFAPAFVTGLRLVRRSRLA